MKPKVFDREVMDLIFGQKINFLQNAVDGLLKARESNIEDDLVAALENLEEQITGLPTCYYRSRVLIQIIGCLQI